MRNDTISIYFADATLAGRLRHTVVSGAKVEAAGGVFQVRDDERKARISAGPHKAP